MKKIKRTLSVFLILILLTFCFVPMASAEEAPVAETKYGAVRGLYFNGGECYYGIPYAKATTGKLRFMPPQAPEKWEGVYNATKQPKDPIQGSYSASNQSEDSLKLYVWVPDTETNEPLSVMFWIYGGSYSSGGINESYYDMEKMAKDTGSQSFALIVNLL